MPEGVVEQDPMLEPVSVEQPRAGGQGQVADAAVAMVAGQVAGQVADGLDDAYFAIRSKELRTDLSLLTTRSQDLFSKSDLLHVSSFHRMPLHKLFVGFVSSHWMDAVMFLIISKPASFRRRTYQVAATHSFGTRMKSFPGPQVNSLCQRGIL